MSSKPRPRGHRSALVLVNLQNDFMGEGSRAVGDAETLVPLINTIRNKFQWDLVALSRNSHAPNHSSFLSSAVNKGVDVRMGTSATFKDGSTYKYIPDNCVEGTEGAALPAGFDTDVYDYIVTTGANPAVPSYSAFRDLQPEVRGEFMTGLGKQLSKANVTDVYVMGLGFEETVAQTALDARALGFVTNVVIDGCLGWLSTKVATCNALEEAGVEILHSSVLLEANKDPASAAQAYIEANGIHFLFEKLTAALVYEQPINPKEFLVRELVKLQTKKYQSSNRLALLSDDDLSIMFGMLDPLRKGKLTGKEVMPALEGLAVIPKTPIDPEEIYDEKKFKALVTHSMEK